MVHRQLCSKAPVHIPQPTIFWPFALSTAEGNHHILKGDFSISNEEYFQAYPSTEVCLSTMSSSPLLLKHANYTSVSKAAPKFQHHKVLGTALIYKLEILLISIQKKKPISRPAINEVAKQYC